MLRIQSNIEHISRDFKETRRDLSELLRPSLVSTVKAIVQRGFDDVFRMQGIPKWVKISPWTLREKQRRGYANAGILVRTGRLMKSYTTESADSEWQTTPTRLIFSSKVPYAGYHEQGTSRMPARSVIRSILLHKDVKRSVLKAVAEEVGRKL